MVCLDGAALICFPLIVIGKKTLKTLKKMEVLPPLINQLRKAEVPITSLSKREKEKVIKTIKDADGRNGIGGRDGIDLREEDSK
jgi:hypothetical protein